MPLFQFCVQSIVSSLQSPTIQTIAFIYRPDIKEKMGLVITLLRLLYFIGEDEMATVLSGCHKNLLECLEITQYYTRWMFNGMYYIGRICLFFILLKLVWQTLIFFIL